MLRSIRSMITTALIASLMLVGMPASISMADEVALNPCTVPTASVAFKVAPNLPKDLSDYTGKTWEGSWIGVGNDFPPLPARLTVIYIDTDGLVNIRQTWGDDGSGNSQPGANWIKVVPDGNGGLMTPPEAKFQYTFKIVDGQLVGTRLSDNGIASATTMSGCAIDPPTTASR